jgi:hypothetical protein
MPPSPLEVEPNLMDRIRKTQKGDEQLEGIREIMKEGKAKEFREDEKGHYSLGNVYVCRRIVSIGN